MSACLDDLAHVETPDGLATFIAAARRQGFAGDGSNSVQARGIKAYVVAHGPWRYEDRYVGSSLDSGSEVVYFDHEPVWSMVYRGGLCGAATTTSGALFAFLKEVLRTHSGSPPARGPRQLEASGFVYTLSLDGDLASFSAVEAIQQMGVLQYKRVMLGGSIE